MILSWVVLNSSNFTNTCFDKKQMCNPIVLLEKKRKTKIYYKTSLKEIQINNKNKNLYVFKTIITIWKINQGNQDFSRNE